MKTFALTLLALCILFISASPSASAQLNERELKKEIRSKAIKTARKEAKKYKKEGWMNTPGSIPIDKQLESTWMKIYQEDGEGRPANLHADGNAVGETRTAAEMAALETAKLQLAGQLESHIAGIVKANIGNAQLNREEAASITKVLSASKNVIATQLNFVDVSLKMYREVKKTKNIEVNLKVIYSWEKALLVAKKSLKDAMDKEMEGLHEKLDELMKVNP